MIYKFDCDKYEHIRVSSYNCGGYFLYFKNEKHPLNKDYLRLVFGGMYPSGIQAKEIPVYVVEKGKILEIYEKTHENRNI